MGPGLRPASPTGGPVARRDLAPATHYLET
jgi:hypothetical protein